MKYNPEIHKRKSIRLKNYDYSQAGLYFITICVQNRECLFGNIGRGEPVCSPSPIHWANTQVRPYDYSPNSLPKMILNDAGKMIEKWYSELENKFPNIRCHEMVVMPNHFHSILEIVGADLRVCPDIEIGQTNKQTNKDEHVGSSLHTVVQWFKTMSTNEYIRGVKNLNWQPFDRKLWQRNYYEHIIRNEQSYENISNYVINNPAQWHIDKLYQP
jgi:REP element-mobilizing transposase RayT